MVRVSDLLPGVGEAIRPILASREGLIATLEGDERFRALYEAVQEAEVAATAHISALLLHSTKPVDQRKVDFTRGYFAALNHWLGGGRIDVAKQRILMMEARESEEADA